MSEMCEFKIITSRKAPRASWRPDCLIPPDLWMFVNGRELITTYWAVSFFPGLITHLVVLVINQTIHGQRNRAIPI